MLFKKYEVIENKLSEQLSDDNPYKKKLIEMETPKDKSPIYSSLSIGLLVYVWLFLFTIVCNKAYGYECAILIVIFITLCFFIVYHKSYLLNQDRRSNIIFSVILFIITLFSIVISFADEGDMELKNIGKTFLFFVDINNKSYIAISLLAFTSIGVASTYYKCPYDIYRAFYSENRTFVHEINEEIRINKFHRLSIVLIIGFIPLIYIIFNTAKDSYLLLLKTFSMGAFLYFPIFLVTSFIALKYLKTFKKAIKYKRLYIKTLV